MKLPISNYTFNASSKTIEFNDYATINLADVLLINNASTNTIIYNFAIPYLGGNVSDNILTLVYDTTYMSNTDPLLIYYDDITVEPATKAKQDEAIAMNSYNYIQFEEVSTYKYYGFASTTAWKIKRKTLSTEIWQIAYGTGDYDTAWAARASKTYTNA